MTFAWTLIFIALVFWRPQEWLVPWLYGWPLLDVVVLFAAGFLVLEANEGRIRFPRRLPQVHLLLGLWVSAAILSHAAHTYFMGIVNSLFPVFKVCFFTLLLICVLDRTSRLRMMARVFIIMALTMVVHCLLQQERGYGFAYATPLYVPPIGDAPAYFRSQYFGIFADPNDTAQFLASCIPFAFVLMRRQSIFSFMIGCVISWYLYQALQTTHSRGGVVGLAGVIAVLVVLRFPPRWIPRLVGVGLIGALALCPFAGVFLDESARDRVVFWGMANWAFKRNPVFGLGYEMFWQVIPKSRAAHNAFVACYTELGLVGYWFWFGLIQLGVVNTWRVRRALKSVRHPEGRWLYHFSGMSLAAMGGFCASGYFLSRTFVFPLFFMVGILAVLPTVARRYLPDDYPSLVMKPKKMVIWLTVGSIASVIYIYISIILLNKAWGG
jgi:putative inorganic carbon (HCO3(-)) transporter